MLSQVTPVLQPHKFGDFRVLSKQHWLPCTQSPPLIYLADILIQPTKHSRVIPPTHCIHLYSRVFSEAVQHFAGRWSSSGFLTWEQPCFKALALHTLWLVDCFLQCDASRSWSAFCKVRRFSCLGDIRRCSSYPLKTSRTLCCLFQSVDD